MAEAKPHVDVSEILQSHARKLLSDFREDEKTTPAALDRGIPRETAVRDFLRAKLPGRYGVGDGVVIDSAGEQSRQCDVVIYDSESSPRLSTERSMSIWPFEFVYAVAQLKSKLTRDAFKDAVENIAAFKALTRSTNNLAGGDGFYAYAGFQNPTCGILIAHEWGDDLQPDMPEFEEILGSVPARQQIDLYCVISGHAGCRARGEQGAITLGLVQGDEGPDIPMHHWKRGEGALAFFLLATIGTLSRIHLGEPGVFQYLRFLPKDK